MRSPCRAGMVPGVYRECTVFWLLGWGQDHRSFGKLCTNCQSWKATLFHGERDHCPSCDMSAPLVWQGFNLGPPCL